MKRQRGEASSAGGIGVLGVLGIVFITLKLIGVEPVASWSWWLVTAPFWGGFAIVAIVALIWGIVYAGRRLTKHNRYGR